MRETYPLPNSARAAGFGVHDASPSLAEVSTANAAELGPNGEQGGGRQGPGKMQGKKPANPIFKGRCRYCTVTGQVRYMLIQLADGEWRKTGPFCADEDACWRHRHPPMEHAERLEDIYS